MLKLQTACSFSEKRIKEMKGEKILVGAMASSILVPAAVSAEDNDKVKLTFYGWSDEESYLQPLFDAFYELSETS